MKKKIIYLSIILVLVISVITLSSIYKSKDNKYKKEYNTISKGMAIMIKEKGATDYVKSNSKDIPKGNYVLNEEKTYCENNGKVTNYNSTTGTVSLNFIGSDRCYLYFDYEVPPRIGYEAILLDNGNGATTVDAAKAYIEGRTTSTTPNFSTKATTNEGMYSAKDDLGTSYYFRGAVDNNWVKYGKYTKDTFITKVSNNNYSLVESCDGLELCAKLASKGDDMYWRIIRINGDNSIRMIYTGTSAPDNNTKVVMTESTNSSEYIRATSAGRSKFNQNSNSAEYVGYMFTVGQQHGTGTDSTIKTYLDNWYANYTDLNKTGTKITDQIYCNDRTASTSGGAYSTTNYTTLTSWNSTGTEYLYGARGRLINSKSPILTCPTASDKFTVNTSNGNGALTYPIGLITADELTFAGLPGLERNSSFYLYTDAYYWAGSPHEFFEGEVAKGFAVRGDGLLPGDSVDGSGGVRPVVSLSSKAKLLGNGTYNDVYTVVGDNSTEDTSSGKSFDTVFAANNTDIFSENGLRYEGADPKNYICLDNKTGGACSDSSLLFRIIGLFEEDTSSDGTNSSGTKKLLKVIDTNNYGGTSGKKWNSAGTNNWSTASLKTELNDPYLTTLLDTIGVNSKLNDAIANAKWHLGGASLSNYNTLTAEGIYTQERNTSAIYSGNPSSVYAKIGLMYPSDYGYATVGGTTTNKSSCRAKAVYGYDTADCKNNDWLFTSKATSWGSNITEWLLSPYSSSSSYAAGLRSSGYVGLDGNYVGNSLFAVRPTFYLDSSVLKIVGTGDGSSTNPYRIG